MPLHHFKSLYYIRRQTRLLQEEILPLSEIEHPAICPMARADEDDDHHCHPCLRVVKYGRTTGSLKPQRLDQTANAQRAILLRKYACLTFLPPHPDHLSIFLPLSPLSYHLSISHYPPFPVTTPTSLLSILIACVYRRFLVFLFSCPRLPLSDNSSRPSQI